MNVSFSLTPVKNYDQATNSFWGYLNEYPQISAVANTEKELETSLLEVFVTMLANEKEILKTLVANLKINGNQSHQIA